MESVKASYVSVLWAEVDVNIGPASGVGVNQTTLLFSICLLAGCTATEGKEGGGTIAVTCGAVCNFAAKGKGKKSLPDGLDFVGVAAMRAVPHKNPKGDGREKWRERAALKLPVVVQMAAPRWLTGATMGRRGA